MADTAIRPPLQQRSRSSFERVLRAARELLEEEGYPGFTLASVSARAGVSVGAIYARVPSKDALFYAVHARVMEELAEQYDKIVEEESDRGLSARELVQTTVRRFAEPFPRYSAILRVVMHRGAVDELVAELGSEASSEQAERFRSIILARRSEIVHPNPELAVDVAYRMMYCTLARQVMYGPTFESSHPVDWDELVREIGKAAAAYLLG
ncbi:MAG TPA: TetR/AcrR family transcriptional regulator [Solirubrobacteraceae bacterium]|jgi:AcrR family transcriptional regulator